jgi:hypothetical protein
MSHQTVEHFSVFLSNKIIWKTWWVYACFSMTWAHEGIPMFSARISFSLILIKIINLPLTLLRTKHEDITTWKRCYWCKEWKKQTIQSIRFTFSSNLGNEMLFQDLKFGPDQPFQVLKVSLINFKCSDWIRTNSRLWNPEFLSFQTKARTPIRNPVPRMTNVQFVCVTSLIRKP